MKNKVSYVELLKEAISEYDTKSFDYKGPLIAPIISYDGEGELKTQKDATSVLERYYFKGSHIYMSPKKNENLTFILVIFLARC